MLEESKGQEFHFEIVTVDRYGKETNRRQGSARQKIKDLGNGTSLEMVYIPEGEFWMGTEDEEIERLVEKTNAEWFRWEKPKHKVTVPSFYMGKYPITQAQWRVITSLSKIERDLILNPSYFEGENRPVEQMVWYQAVEFCQRLSKLKGKEYRLPSEAEWEYACRAGTNTPFHFGETITTEIVNYDGNKTYAEEGKGVFREETTPVGKFPPNAFGLYDMHGNVWELCLDDWHENYEGAPRNGSAWMYSDDRYPYKCLRGGSWFCYPWVCHSANRLGYFPRSFNLSFGFRVVCRYYCYITSKQKC